jgi:hypothetical protein
MTFLGDAGKIWERAFQFAPWRTRCVLQRRHGRVGESMTGSSRRGEQQTNQG